MSSGIDIDHIYTPAADKKRPEKRFWKIYCPVWDSAGMYF
jgi:hypothetical protein